MTIDRNLDINIESVGEGGDAYPVARVAVVETYGSTRDGNAVTISADCKTLPALERELGRLHGELDDALIAAQPALGGKASQVRRERQPPSEVKRHKNTEAPQLDVELSVADIMTREVCIVDRNDSLAQAKQQMDSGGFRHVVVLNESGEVSGVLSDRDIGFNALAWSLGQGRHGYEASLEGKVVKEVMRSEPHSIDSSASVCVAAQQMIDRKVSCLPVLEAEALVGIVTTSDFLWLFRTRSQADLPRSPQ